MSSTKLYLQGYPACTEIRHGSGFMSNRVLPTVLNMLRSGVVRASFMDNLSLLPNLQAYRSSVIFLIEEMCLCEERSCI